MMYYHLPIPCSLSIYLSDSLLSLLSLLSSLSSLSLSLLSLLSPLSLPPYTYLSIRPPECHIVASTGATLQGPQRSVIFENPKTRNPGLDHPPM